LGDRAFGFEQVADKQKAMTRRFLEAWTSQYSFLGRLTRMSGNKRDTPLADLVRLAVGIEAEAAQSARLIASRKSLEASDALCELSLESRSSKDKSKHSRVEPRRALAAILEGALVPAEVVSAMAGQVGQGDLGADPPQPSTNVVDASAKTNRPANNAWRPKGSSNRPWDDRRCWSCGGQGHTSRFCKTPMAQAIPWTHKEQIQPVSEAEAEVAAGRLARKRSRKNANAASVVKTTVEEPATVKGTPVPENL
jgi:hypothetical protein